MAASVYFPHASRSSNGHLSPGLPVYSTSSSSSAVREKLALRNPSSWFILVSLPIPGLRARRLRMVFVNPRRLYHLSVSRFGRKKGSAILCLGFLLFVFVAFILAKRFDAQGKDWSRPFIGKPSTLIYKREDLQRIWQWEVASGHYPSRRRLPDQLRLQLPPENPAIPPQRTLGPSQPSSDLFTNITKGIGPKRVYLNIESKPPSVAYPPRPVPGSIADLDVVMEHCDFSKKKYVRDCLEVLRVGAGLDNGNRVRRGRLDDWKYIYVEKPDTANFTQENHARHSDSTFVGGITKVNTEVNPDAGLTKMRGADWEIPPIALPATIRRRSLASSSPPCDHENPRLFHMFWTGPFTDKPYSALLSFLFTQNTGLHLKDPPDDTICRPMIWMWINPGPAAAVPNPSATRDMFTQLRTNAWASPFLHRRFKDVIKFKLWNTTEQLDGIPELKDEWRSRDLFNSGGHIIPVPQENNHEPNADGETGNRNGAGVAGPTDADGILNRAGSKSSSTYDRLSVILSDMARFILCHRFGGTYLDADTIFLRDWEELWGWKGAFAYRWSRMTRYNTAVLHMNKGSALGTFLFRTALKNDLDFHPMTISRYTKDAHLEGLLLRLPDALFDPAWLNTEHYQRDRPPQPYFTDFADFFETPVVNSAVPQASAFDGFFKGAYSYHFHNAWWKPFDPARNWPDLGSRFRAGEHSARVHTSANVTLMGDGGMDDTTDVVDQRDLGWATVLKRTFEAYIRGERPNMYGEWLQWPSKSERN